MFNDRPLTQLAGTLTRLLGAEIPTSGNPEGVDKIFDLVKEKTGRETVDKLLIYNPDAIGEWYYKKYKSVFAGVEEACSLIVEYITATPSVTPVCFGTMFTGAEPSVHGIQKYEKPVIRIDSIFDSFRRAGKKVAMVSVKNQSIPKIFAERDIDYFLLDTDAAVVEKALELIEKSDYDVIEVYNQEYDDALHRTHRESKRCNAAARHYVESFCRLASATESFWKDKSTFLAFAPDHGSHNMFKILGPGLHGAYIPDDMNIVHFYGVQPAQRSE